MKTAAVSGMDLKGQKDVIEGAAKPKPAESKKLLDFVQRTATHTYASSEKLQQIGKNYEPKATYPGTPLANRLKLCAQLIDAGLGARMFYVSIDGFDTHASQGGAAGRTRTCSARCPGRSRPSRRTWRPAATRTGCW